MNYKLSIVCVTRAEKFAIPFLQQMEQLAQNLDAEFVIAADGQNALHALANEDFSCLIMMVNVLGPSLEEVLDKAVAACSGIYVLRLDDDERCSPAMVKWLEDLKYAGDDHWCFPRVHFWKNDTTALITEHLWPDLQTRLSVKSKSGGRIQLHAGSPYGPGQRAPVAIEHHKFLCRPYAERQAIAARYDAFHKGFGTGMMLPYSLPEDAYKAPVRLVGYTDGRVPWTPPWERMARL